MKWLFAFALTALTAASAQDLEYDLRYLQQLNVQRYVLSHGSRYPGGLPTLASVREHEEGILNDATVSLGRFVEGNSASMGNNRVGRERCYNWRQAIKAIIRGANKTVAFDYARQYGGIVDQPLVVHQAGGTLYWPKNGLDEYVQADGMSAANRTYWFGTPTFERPGTYQTWLVMVPIDDDGRLDIITFFLWKECGNLTRVSGISRIRTVNVPGPERRVEVPGPERRVEVPGPERRVEVPGPERVVEKRVEVPGPERVVYRDRVICHTQTIGTPMVLLAPPGQRLGEQTRSNWSMPVTQVLATGYVALLPSPKPYAQQPSNTGCAPGGAPNPTTLPPGPNPNPGASTATEPNPPGAPPVTGPGSGGEVGTNTPQPSTPNPGNSTVPGKPPAGSVPDTTGLKNKPAKK